MSSSSALTPRPAATARPSAAGTSTPSGAGTGAVTESRVGSQTSRREQSTMTQARIAHTRRGPLAIARGTSAITTSPSVYQPDRAGPVSKRNASPSVSGERTRRACVAGSAPSSDQIHGEASTTARAAPSSASAAARNGDQSPHANNVESANATASNTGKTIAGGHAATAIAPSRPITTTAWTFPRRPPDARTNACNTNGASANSTSGPRSPRPI